MKKWFVFGLCLMATVLVLGWSGVGTSFAACPVVGCTVCIDATTATPTCTVIRADGVPLITTITNTETEAHLEVTSSAVPNINAFCKLTLERAKGPAVVYDTNTEPGGLCCIVTPEDTFETNDWIETVSGSGNISLSCHYPGTE